jgi:hypothetical protein
MCLQRPSIGLPFLRSHFGVGLRHTLCTFHRFAMASLETPRASSSKACVAIVHRGAKLFVNEPGLLPAVLRELGLSGPPPVQAVDSLASLAMKIQGIVASRTGRRCPHLRDAAFWMRRAKVDSGLVKAVLQLNAAYSWSRHMTSSACDQLLVDIETSSFGSVSCGCSAASLATSAGDACSGHAAGSPVLPQGPGGSAGTSLPDSSRQSHPGLPGRDVWCGLACGLCGSRCVIDAECLPSGSARGSSSVLSEACWPPGPVSGDQVVVRSFHGGAGDSQPC